MLKKHALVIIVAGVVVVAAFAYFATNGSGELSDSPGGDYFADELMNESEHLQEQEIYVPDDGRYASATLYQPRDLHDMLEAIMWQAFSWDDYVYLLERATPINQTLTYENFEIEVLGAIATSGVPFYDVDWEYMINLYEETGVWPQDDVFEEISIFRVIKLFFLSISDLEGQRDLSRATLRDVEVDFACHRRSHSSGLMLAHYDENTSRVYLVVGYSAYAPAYMASLSNPFTIGQVCIGHTEFTKDLGIPIADILNSHEAGFGEYYYRTMESIEFIMSSPVYVSTHRAVASDGIGPMWRISSDNMLYFDELDINAYYDIYITNIALVDDLLIVQVREPFFQGIWPSLYDWINLVLVDTRVESQCDLPILEIWEQRAIRELIIIDLTDFDAEEPVEHRLLERVFIAPDSDMLPYLDFNAMGFYFEERVPVYFYFPGAHVPIIPSPQMP